VLLCPGQEQGYVVCSSQTSRPQQSKTEQVWPQLMSRELPPCTSGGIRLCPPGLSAMQSLQTLPKKNSCGCFSSFLLIGSCAPAVLIDADQLRRRSLSDHGRTPCTFNFCIGNRNPRQSRCASYGILKKSRPPRHVGLIICHNFPCRCSTKETLQ
jgi:hypothetical protein